MKEATGELNMTVVVVISVGILVAFFFGVIWPFLRNNFESESQCNSLVCDCSESVRNYYKSTVNADLEMCVCSSDGKNLNYYDKNAIWCPFKG